jgi:hypothetical protein
MKNRPNAANPRESGANLLLCAPMATQGSYQIHTESRGPHWIAWISRGDGKPEGSVVLVAASQAEAEERARRWAEAQER